MPDPIRVAVVGFGAEAQWWECQADAARDAGVVRVESPGMSPGDFPRRWHGVLRDAPVDAVCVCGQLARRPELTIDALDAGKHVLAVPPVATDWDNASRMAEIARARDVVLRTATPDQHRPALARVRAWISAGAIGDPLVLTCRAGRPALHEALAEDDALEALLVRAAGVASWLEGGFTEVIGMDSPTGETAAAIFSHTAGSVAWVQVSLDDDVVAFEVEVSGRDGYATAHSGGEGLERAALGPRDPIAPFRETVLQSVRPDTYGAQEWRAFAAAIRTGGSRDAVEDTLTLVRMFLAARRSAQTEATEVA